MQKVTDPALLAQLNGGGQVASRPVQQSSAPGIIMGRPKAPDPYRVQQDQIDNARADVTTSIAVGKDQRDAAEFAQKQEEERRKRERQAGAISSAKAEIEAVIRDAEEAKRLSREGFFATGAGAGWSSGFGGTSASDVAALLDTIGGNLAFDKLQRMRDSSPTGGALGQVTEKELDLLRSSVASLKQTQSDEQFQRNMDRIIQIYGGMLGKLEMEENPASPETAQQMMQWAAGAVSPQGSGESGSPPQGPTGNFAATVNTDALGPGEKFLFDENGTPIAIQASDGSISGYSAIVDNISEREARQRLEDNGGMGYAKGGEAGLNRGVMLGLSDEIGGIAAGLGELARGGEFGKGYREARDTERVAQDISRQEAGIAPELVGGLLIPGGALGTAKNVGQFVRQGAALGAVGGFGEGEGASGSAINALTGAAVGSAVGGALSQAPRAINALMQTAPAQKIASATRRSAVNLDRNVVEAGQRQSIPIRQPDARPETRNAFAVVEASPTQGEKVRKTLEADREAVRARLDEVGGEGNRVDNFTMGETVQGAGQRYIVKSREQANALYRRAEAASGGTKVNPEQALQSIDDNIAELTAAGPKANAGAIKYLKDLRSDLGRGELSIEQLRSIRTNMRGQISERNLTATDAERRVGDVLRAASADIERGLSNNPQALGAYKAADAFYQEKQTFIKDVVQRFTGSRNNPLSAEQAASKFQAMMRNKGDYKRFSEMVKRLEPEERADMAASIAEELGKGRNGEFTLAGLATNIEKMNPRALRDLFGEDGAMALSDLRIIARAKADTAGGLNNSKSGVVMAANNQFKDVLLGAVGGGIGGIPGAMGGLAARSGVERLSSARAARLLLNPDFTKWLRQTPSSTSPTVINRHFDRLNKIASREQVFLMDAQALQSFIRDQFSKGTGRAAAEDQTKDNRGE